MKDLKQEALNYHLGGKLAVTSKVKLDTSEDLTLAYSPGVAFASTEIAKDKTLSYKYTSRKNMIAVITDGSAVLGLGDIGPEAAMPVMEGKSLLFKKFAGIDAIPICLNTKDPDEIVKTIEFLSPSFGGINLEDISFPRCIEIEERLNKSLDIPVFHDDQKGTAVVTTAALINAVKLVGKKLEDLTVALSGVGAAGSSIAKMLRKIGVKKIYAYNLNGVISRNNPLIPEVEQLIDDGVLDSFDDFKDNTLAEIMAGADVFIGVSVANLVTSQMVDAMADKPIVFALANPNPEIDLNESRNSKAFIYATGRSDYPNQINNVLAFPGIFKGILNSIHNKISDEMCLNAAYAIASIIKEDELKQEYIIPSAFNMEVVEKVANAIINTKL